MEAISRLRWLCHELKALSRERVFLATYSAEVRKTLQVKLQIICYTPQLIRIYDRYNSNTKLRVAGKVD